MQRNLPQWLPLALIALVFVGGAFWWRLNQVVSLVPTADSPISPMPRADLVAQGSIAPAEKPPQIIPDIPALERSTVPSQCAAQGCEQELVGAHIVPGTMLAVPNRTNFELPIVLAVLEAPKGYLLVTMSVAQSMELAGVLAQQSFMMDGRVTHVTMEDVSLENRAIVTVHGTGEVQQRFLADLFVGYRSMPHILPIIGDKGREQAVVTVHQYTFAVPYKPELSYNQYGWGGISRDTNIESTLKQKPVYHRDACGSPLSLTDDALYFYGYGGGGVSLRVHYGKFAKALLTTPNIGYAPSEWGKINGEISLDAFRSEIIEGVEVAGKPTKTLDLGGHIVRRVGPFALDRTCAQGGGEKWNDVYQWVDGDVVLTLTFDDVVLSVEERQVIVGSIAQSFALR